MPAMVQNVLQMDGITNEEWFRKEKYYSGSEKKIREEFDFEKFIPVPGELKREHSLLNDVKILFYLTGGLSEGKEVFLERIKKEKHIYKLLSERVHIDHIYDIAMDFTRSMSSRKTKSLFDDGKVLKENLETFGCADSTEYQLEHWGCIWNATSTKIIDDNTISFLTPDSPPHKVIEEIANHLLPEHKGTSKTENMLFHVWFPEDYSASTVIGAGRCYYYKENGKVKPEEKITDLKKPDLYDIYYKYKDDALGAHKMSAFNSETFDRIYFRLQSDLREKYISLCKLEGTNLAKSIQALAQKTVDEGNIPFDRKKAEKESGKYSGEMVHTNIRLSRMLRREFDAVAQEAGTTVNRIIVEYMMICLDNMGILIKDEN